MKKSVWLKNVRNNPNDMKKELTVTETDVLIVGAGMAGLSTAYELMNKNLSVLVIDKSKIGCGATGLSTGKVSYAHGFIYQQLTKSVGFDRAQQYFHANLTGLKKIKKRVEEHHIDCGFTRVPTYLFINNRSDMDVLLQEKVFYHKCKIKTTIEDQLPISFPCYKALKINNQYIFQPYHYLQGLKQVLLKNKINIQEYVKAISLKKLVNGYEVFTSKGIIRCRDLVVCSHYPFFNVPGYLFAKVHVEKSYLVERSFSMKKDFIAINNGSSVHSIRFYDGNLIYGGANHLLSTSIQPVSQYQKITRESFRFFKGQKLSCWMSQDVMTGDCIPYIGSMQDHLFVATGFHKWGMTNGTIAGSILSDLILGKKNQYVSLFDPSRPFNKDRFLTAIKDNIFSGKNFLLSKIKYNKTCTHLGCSLCFNTIDETYDCPCHGSRFTKDGEVIEGPATKNLDQD